ncbi:MAG: DMT family transporter [Hyphomicrobiales bacterium]|nr:DMT family transporter [Hyphomicrobiales bacterium]MCP5371135.1 DMT family transporter [Hyphomicrobiales bacterium]
MRDTDALAAPVGAPAGEPPARRGRAMALMVVASSSISFGGLIMRSIAQADPWQVTFYRGLALFLAVALILALRYRRAAWDRVRGVGRPGLVGGVLLGLAGISFVQALAHTTVANALFTLGAIPFITAALAWLLLGERPRPATLVTMAVAAAGIFVMVGEGLGGGSVLGNLLALATALCFSSFAVIVRRHRGVDMLPALLASGLFIVLVAGAVRLGDLAVPWRDLGLCFLWGGLLSGVANWFFVIASRHLVAAELTLFMMLEFALGPVWVWLFVGETPGRGTLAGGVLVLAAVAARALVELRDSAPRLRRGRPSPT